MAADKVKNDPAYFNPSVQDSPSPNYLGYARGVDAPRATNKMDGSSDIWGQIGNVVRQTVEGTIDTTIKTGIDESLRRDAEDVRDVANNTVLPAELSRGTGEMSKITRARNAGTMSDTHYWATMDYLVRKQRQRFPGYGDYIDQSISNITGAVPANALRRELASAAESTNSEEKAWMQYKKENDKYIQRNFGDSFWEAEAAGKGPERSRVYAAVAKTKAYELELDINKNEIGNKSAAGKLTNDEADRGAAQEFWGNLDSARRVATSGYGKTYDELQKSLAAARDIAGPGGASITPEEREQVTTMFNNFRTAGAQMMDQTLNGYSAQMRGSYKQFMSPGAVSALQKNYEDYIGNFEKEIFDKNAGTLLWEAAADEANQASTISKIRKKNEYVATASAIADQRLLGPLGQGIYLNNETNLSNLTNEVMKLHSKETLAGTAGPAKAALDKMGAKEGFVTPSEEGKAVVGSVRKTIDVITNGDPSDKAVQNAVESFFGPANQGFLAGIDPSDSKTPSKDKKSAREKILLQMTAPGFLKKIKDTAERTGNVELMDNVARWTEDSATTLFKEEALRLQSFVTDYSKSGALSFDGTTNRFKITDFSSTSRGAPVSSQFKESLDRVNMSLKSLENVYLAQGFSPEEVSDKLVAYFTNPAAFGINMSAPATQRSSLGDLFSAANQWITAKQEGGDGKSSPIAGARMNAGAPAPVQSLEGLDPNAPPVTLDRKMGPEAPVTESTFQRMQRGWENIKEMTGAKPTGKPYKAGAGEFLHNGEDDPKWEDVTLPRLNKQLKAFEATPLQGLAQEFKEAFKLYKANPTPASEAYLKTVYDTFQEAQQQAPGGSTEVLQGESLRGRANAGANDNNPPPSISDLLKSTNEKFRAMDERNAKMEAILSEWRGSQAKAAGTGPTLVQSAAPETPQSKAPAPVSQSFSDEWSKNRADILDKTGRPVEYFQKLQEKGAKYVIVDRHTGAVVGDSTTLRGAINSVDRRDNRYGGYRFAHERISDLVEGKQYMQEKAIGAGGLKSSGVIKKLNEDDLPK